MIPDTSVVEQASSTSTAGFVASLMPEDAIAADLTAGLGVNTLYMSKKALKVYAIERDINRAEALSANLHLLGVDNVEVVNGDCIEWLKTSETYLDFVFADPARRTEGGRRHILLEDYSPDISQIMPLLKGRCHRFLVKVSPLLDITALMESLPGLKGVLIVESGREVKELLLDISPEEECDNPYIECVILNDDSIPLSFRFLYSDKGKNKELKYIGPKESMVGGFIYEPSPSLMKASLFGALAIRFPGLQKLDFNTHLFYNKEQISDFPGRIFKIECSLGSKELKSLKGGRLNVISRNHPAKAPEFETRYKLKSSDKDFLIAATAAGKKVVLKSTKL